MTRLYEFAKALLFFTIGVGSTLTLKQLKSNTSLNAISSELLLICHQNSSLQEKISSLEIKLAQTESQLEILDPRLRQDIMEVHVFKRTRTLELEVKRLQTQTAQLEFEIGHFKKMLSLHEVKLVQSKTKKNILKEEINRKQVKIQSLSDTNKRLKIQHEFLCRERVTSNPPPAVGTSQAPAPLTSIRLVTSNPPPTVVTSQAPLANIGLAVSPNMNLNGCVCVFGLLVTSGLLYVGFGTQVNPKNKHK